MAKNKKNPIKKPEMVGPKYNPKQKGKAGYQYLSKYELKNEPDIVLQYKAKWRLSQHDPFSAAMYSKEAINYFRKHLPKDTKQSNQMRIKLYKADEYDSRIPRPGELVFFSYSDPVHKKTLPYYDIWPMVFVIGYYTSKEGNKLMYGLNMHYLPPAMREFMFTKLLDIKTGAKFKKYKPDQKLKISWQIVKALSESHARAMVHTYRLDHVTGIFRVIPATAWNVVTFLPTAKFMKMKQQDVWRDVMKKSVKSG